MREKSDGILVVKYLAYLRYRIYLSPPKVLEIKGSEQPAWISEPKLTLVRYCLGTYNPNATIIFVAVACKVAPKVPYSNTYHLHTKY